MSNSALVAEHNRLLALNMKCVGGGAWMRLCCEYEHPICHFNSTSLYCIIIDCQNPHHREAPDVQR